MKAKLSTVLETVAGAFRRIKVLRYGTKDVQTPLDAAPFGIDSNPIPKVKAIYAQTEEDANPFVIGYVIQDKIAEIGECRLFSLMEDGSVSTFIHLRNDGTINLAGDADNAVRFQPMADAIEANKAAINDIIQKWNVFAAAYVPGGPTLQGTPPSANTATASNADPTGARIDEITTP